MFDKLLRNINYLNGSPFKYSKAVQESIFKNDLVKITEDHILNHIVVKLKELTESGELNAVWFHVPNESLSKDIHSMRYNSKRLLLGLIPGSPDLVLVFQDRTILVEVKTITGKPSESQKQFKLWCENKYVRYVIVRSWEELEYEINR